jgi:tripartite-type tricarboxylate transporter receptor subunit TctC
MGSSGTGTISHLFLERLKRAAGVDITHVPYRGGSLAIQDLSAGAIDMMFDAIPALLPHIREGASARSPPAARAGSPTCRSWPGCPAWTRRCPAPASTR